MELYKKIRNIIRGYFRKQNEKYYAEKYPNILKTGKRYYLVKTILISICVFGILGSIWDFKDLYPWPFLQATYSDFENIVFPNLIEGLIFGVVFGTFNWAWDKEGYLNYKKNKNA